MQAKVFCKNHGTLGLEDIQIKDGSPICKKCSAELTYANVKPRKVKK